MRRQPYRTHYLLASLAVLLLTTVLFPLPSFAVMTTTDTEDAANQEWFATIGTELMRSQATDVFGQDIANDPLLLSVGVAHHVYTFSDKKMRYVRPIRLLKSRGCGLLRLLKEIARWG